MRMFETYYKIVFIVQLKLNTFNIVLLKKKVTDEFNKITMIELYIFQCPLK